MEDGFERSSKTTAKDSPGHLVRTYVCFILASTAHWRVMVSIIASRPFTCVLLAKYCTAPGVQKAFIHGSGSRASPAW